MDTLWVGLGISAVVGFVFYVLAGYWQRLLKGHSRAIRALFDRIATLEQMEDPRFRKMVGDSAPSPLEQVYVFSFRLGERFWTHTIGASSEQLRYIREHGKFLGSVKIERWRSHIAVTLTELLPQSQSAGWQTRTVDIYPTKEMGASANLWELYLDSPENSQDSEAPLVLELRMEDESLVLQTRHGTTRLGTAYGTSLGSLFGSSLGSSVRAEEKSLASAGEKILFQVPFDGDQLAAFRVSEDAADGDTLLPASPRADSWLAFYRNQDERQDVEWQLCLRDLDRKTIWERWNIAEPWQTRRVS